MPKKKTDAQLEELTRDLQRVQAEFVNFKRRSGEERQELMSLAKEQVIKQLLPLIDNLDRALAHLPAGLASNPWAQGVEQVGKQVQETLANLGVTRIKALGETFDPHLHEAISLEEGAGDHEVVIEELQPGYQLGERVIRHAVVRVGKPSHDSAQDKTKQKGEKQ